MLSNITPHMLDDLAISQIAELTGEELAVLQDMLDHDSCILKARKERLAAGIERKYADAIKAAYAAERKDTGTVRGDDGAMTVVANVSKTVKWDEVALGEIAAEMDSEECQHYMTWTAKVDERKYVSAPPSVKEKLDKARTVKSGAPKITLQRTAMAAE